MNTARITPGAERELKNHTSLRQTVRNSLTMAYRGLLKVCRTPEQLFDVTVQPILFTLMFTYLFGGAIAGNVHNYLPLIIPGILVQTVITASLVTGSNFAKTWTREYSIASNPCLLLASPHWQERCWPIPFATALPRLLPS